MRAFRAAVIVLTLLLAAAAPARANKATIAVLPFEEGPVLARGEPLETRLLVDVFNRVLVSSRKFSVVDRARLDRVRDEQRFGRSGLADAATAARVGRILGADYLVMGSLLDYTQGPVRELPYGSGWGRDVRISVEVVVVDSTSAQIVSATRASGTAQSRVSSPGAAAGIAYEAFEKAAEAVANDSLLPILAAAYPIKIVEVAGEEVRLNRGAGGGVDIGMQLRCFSAGKDLRDPDTGESLGRSEAFSGSVQVTEVLPKVSVARVIEGGGLSTGNSCRLDSDAAEAASRRAPPPTGPIHSY